MSILAVGKQKKCGRIPRLLLIPIYWLRHSQAAYKAVVQLIAKPFYWEKTIHGISKLTQAEILQAGLTQPLSEH